MRDRLWVVALMLLTIPALGARSPQRESTAAPPPWAYGFESATELPPAAPVIQDNGDLRHLASSALSFTVTQIRDSFGPADWYPGDHPEMPDIVAHGRKPEIRACALCHYPNGKGRPENAGVAGLPYDYIVHELNDFKNDARRSADERKANTYQMIGFAKAMTEDDIKAAARYFSSMRWTPWIKVVEASTVPKTRIGGGMFLRLEGNETEPIGERIIETPINSEATEVLRDCRSGFIAYVPVGSVKRGEALVTTGGGGKTTQCTICHGLDLMGLGPLPGIAGRSPTYIVRQLNDIQHGTRAGVWTNLMKPVVAKLTSDDIISIAAYLASRDIPPASSQGKISSAKDAGY